MRYTFADYQKAADAVAERLGGFQPEIAMILGSGLGDMADVYKRQIYASCGYGAGGRRLSICCPEA